MAWVEICINFGRFLNEKEKINLPCKLFVARRICDKCLLNDGSHESQQISRRIITLFCQEILPNCKIYISEKGWLKQVTGFRSGP